MWTNVDDMNICHLQTFRIEKKLVNYIMSEYNSFQPTDTLASGLISII